MAKINLGHVKGADGTTNYTDMINKPQINGVALEGNKTNAELGLPTPEQVEIVNGELAKSISDASNILNEVLNDPSTTSYTLFDKSYSARDTRLAILDALKAKGADIYEGDKFSDYPAAINTIPSGGEPVKTPNVIYAVPSDTSGRFYLQKVRVELSPEFANATDISNAFVGTGFDLTELPEMPNLTAATRAFRECGNLRNFTLRNYPQLSDCSEMFAECKYLETVTFPADAFNATMMMEMFKGCSMLTNIKLPNLPNVGPLAGICKWCEGLVKFEMGDAPNAAGLFNMLEMTPALTTVIIGDISNAQMMYGAFGNSDYDQQPEVQEKHPNGLHNITNLTIKKLPAVSLEQWGLDLNEKLTVESLVSVMNALPQLSPEQGTLNCKIGEVNKAKLSPEQLKIGEDKGWVIL